MHALLAARALLFLLALALGQRSPVSSQERVQPRPCAEAAGQEIRGTVADLLSKRPLPGATVTLREPAEFVREVLAVTEAGDGGAFSFCAPAIGRGWDVIAALDTVESRGVPVGADGSVDTLYLPWTAAVNLNGRVMHADTREPLAGARIEVAGNPARALTNDDGRFRLRGLGAGPMVLRTTLLGLEPRVDTILVESGANVDLELVMSPDPIELPSIVVTARSVPPSTRARDIHSLGMTREEIDAALPRVIDFTGLLRQSQAPGLLVTEIGSGLCVQFFRRSGGCAMVEVFVNGVRMPGGSDYLANLDPSAVREFILLRPAFAQFQYMGPLTSNGVIDIILR